jgi:hypothetical protein
LILYPHGNALSVDVRMDRESMSLMHSGNWP